MKLCVIMVYNFYEYFQYISRYVESDFGGFGCSQKIFNYSAGTSFTRRTLSI